MMGYFTIALVSLAALLYIGEQCVRLSHRRPS